MIYIAVLVGKAVAQAACDPLADAEANRSAGALRIADKDVDVLHIIGNGDALRLITLFVGLVIIQLMVVNLLLLHVGANLLLLLIDTVPSL